MSCRGFTQFMLFKTIDFPDIQFSFSAGDVLLCAFSVLFYSLWFNIYLFLFIWYWVTNFWFFKKKKNKTSPPQKTYASIIILKLFAKERWETKKTVMELLTFFRTLELNYSEVLCVTYRRYFRSRSLHFLFSLRNVWEP